MTFFIFRRDWMNFPWRPIKTEKESICPNEVGETQPWATCEMHISQVNWLAIDIWLNVIRGHIYIDSHWLPLFGPQYSKSPCIYYFQGLLKSLDFKENPQTWAKCLAYSSFHPKTHQVHGICLLNIFSLVFSE